MDLARVADAYFEQLAAQGEGILEDYSRDDLWTQRATIALTNVGLSLFPDHQPITKAPIAGATRPVRGEHHAMDVVLVAKTGFTDPSFIAEHESSPRKSRLQNDAWRLLTTFAKVRVLVAYWGPNTELATFTEFRNAILEVGRNQRMKELLVIGGESGAKPRTFAALRAVHAHVALGQDTES